jgi:hypothetical protein
MFATLTAAADVAAAAAAAAACAGLRYLRKCSA